MKNGNANGLFKGIPIYVLQALSEARAGGGRNNMSDKGGITRLCATLEHPDAAEWLFEADNEQYVKALEAFPEWEKEQLGVDRAKMLIKREVEPSKELLKAFDDLGINE